jgi:hypothetical protein
MTPTYCGIQIVHDRDGYECGRPASETCVDCGTALCKAHAEACGMCLDILCDSCLYFHERQPHPRKHVGQVVPDYRRSA